MVGHSPAGWKPLARVWNPAPVGADNGKVNQSWLSQPHFANEVAERRHTLLLQDLGAA